MHCNQRRLLRRGLEFHVCTINKSAHTKKSLETYLMILVYPTSGTVSGLEVEPLPYLTKAGITSQYVSSPPKMSVLSITLNFDLMVRLLFKRSKNVQYTFLDMTPMFIWPSVIVPDTVSSMGQIDLFTNYLYLIGIPSILWPGVVELTKVSTMGQIDLFKIRILDITTVCKRFLRKNYTKNVNINVQWALFSYL